MKLQKASSAPIAPPAKPNTPSQPPSATHAPQEQVTLTGAQAEAFNFLQQMQGERQKLNEVLIREVVQPAPPELQAALQATDAVRVEVANTMAQQAQAPAENIYYLAVATDAKTLSNAMLNAENRADYQASQGGTVDRQQLLQQELGYLLEVNLYEQNLQPQALEEVIRQAAAQTQPEAQISAGTFVQAARQLVGPEAAGNVSAIAKQNPLANLDPVLQKRLADSMDQNHQVAAQLTHNCLGYFKLLGDIVAQEAPAREALMSAPGA